MAIADFYKEDWPLLVCTTAVTRDTWAKQVRELLPWVPDQYIVTLNSTSDYFGDAKVIIISYALMERNIDRLEEKKIGFLILVRCDWSRMDRLTLIHKFLLVF